MSDSQIGLEMADDQGRTAAPLIALEQARAGIVHDLGNLIQIALSGLNRVARDPALSNASELEPVITGVRTALHSAGRLVRETIRQEREVHRRGAATDVGACLMELRAMMLLSSDPGIDLKAHIDTGLPLARCDRLGLQNAVLNLLFNAREAMPHGGLISVAATTRVDGATASIELRVEDNGIGMTSETVNRAFDPFFTTKGTGLGGVGLPMVKRFASENGGSIHIESSLGTGTVVILRLPAADTV
jgi:signal transduction histidine kinase